MVLNNNGVGRGCHGMGRRWRCAGNIGPDAAVALFPPPTTMGLFPTTAMVLPSLPLLLPQGRQTMHQLPLDLLILFVNIVVQDKPWQIGIFLLLPLKQTMASLTALAT